MQRGRRRALALAVFLAAVAIAVAGVDFVRFVHGPIGRGAGSDDDQARIFVIEPGTPVRGIADRLAAEGYIDRPLYFRLLARVTGDARRIQAGEYVIEPDTTPYRLLGKFVRGDVRTYSLTVIEGWTFADMIRAVREHEAIRQTLEDHDPSAIMEALGHPGQHPEGRFFPDTYRFGRGTRDLELLRQAYTRMEQVLAEEWAQRAQDLPLDTPYEALILASIVERETGVPDERARIAGVFVARLEQGMRLQTDPTVIYGLGDEFDGNLRFRHLRRDTPYNTYTRGGLPPTPIALPSRASIHAALHPERRGELYFVSTGDGRHVFSKTLEEHNKAVIEYQLGGDASRLRKR